MKPIELCWADLVTIAIGAVALGYWLRSVVIRRRLRRVWGQLMANRWHAEKMLRECDPEVRAYWQGRTDGHRHGLDAMRRHVRWI